jgi:hypothetical protein
MKSRRIGWWIGPTRFRAVSAIPVTIKAWLVFGVGRWGIIIARQEREEESKMEFTWEPLNWSPAKCWRTIARRASGRRVTVLVSSSGHAGATWHITPGGAPHGLTNAEDPRPRAEAWLREHRMAPG